ncbi:unnamed protein product [Symbiodinium sp. CCMP2456]|nr:unnamed protein product [Symbiodinium sp. CCMP2456]
MWLICCCWLWISGCIFQAHGARPAGALDAGAENRQPRQSPRSAVLQTEARHVSGAHAGRRGDVTDEEEEDPVSTSDSPASDSEANDELARTMKAACTRNPGDDINLKDIRGCVKELQSYAQATRHGFVESIEAEKIFVREYQNAAKKLAFMGNTELFWEDIQKEHKNAKTFLLDVASQSAADARDLKEFSKLANKNKTKESGDGEDEGEAEELDADETEDDGDGEDEDEDEDESEDEEDAVGGKDGKKTGKKDSSTADEAKKSKEAAPKSS